MRTKKGIVVSEKREKTITVEVSTYKTHPKYQKRYQQSRRFHVHDPEKQYKVGDKVTIYETRPLSKLKRWTVIKPTEK